MNRNKPKPLTPEESPQEHTILFFDQQQMFREGSNGKQMLRILGQCPDCGNQRWIRVNSLRTRKIHSSLCNPCIKRRQPHPLPKKGTQDANGYRMIHVKLLSPEDRALSEQYLKLHRNAYVYEHRLVALKTYGPRAALPGIVVRHINGNKIDNDPENLILGTQRDNVRDHTEALHEMEAWRALALFLLRRLNL